MNLEVLHCIDISIYIYFLFTAAKNFLVIFLISERLCAVCAPYITLDNVSAYRGRSKSGPKFPISTGRGRT